jgi:WW domain-containing oxidoreductase
VTGLLDQLTDKGRVVMVSSDAHLGAPEVGIDFGNLDGSKGYKRWAFYGQSKLANLLFARQLAKRLAGAGRTANAIHPGVIRTELGRHMALPMRVALSIARPLVLKSIPEGAATQCYVATHPAAEGVTGEYWADCNLKKSSRNGRDMALAEKLWARTEEIVARI